MTIRSPDFPLNAARLAVAGVLAAGGVLLPAAAQAQPVVQALPPRAAGELNTALRRLATRPQDLEALISAGTASLALKDAAAAAGFFTRAAALAPSDARVLLGQARVALEQRRPVAALDGFARAEAAGARALDMAADRALAYDLVGDNASAQALYRSVLATRDDAEVRRRLALSLAIAGNRSEFERTLYPLLKREDRSAYRTRAFGLAALGSTDDAVGIADAMMPTDLALRMAPYLRYMPRLTKAQQAAAGNLGAFPAATEIGRDTSDIAGYAAAGARIAARANSSLTPSGAALGPRTAAPTPTPAPRRAAVAPVPLPAPAPRLTATPAPVRSDRERVAVTIPPAATPPATRVVGAGAAVLPQPAPPAPSATAPARPSLAEAFADLDVAPAAGPAPGAVDVAELTAARRLADADAARAERARVAREAKARADKAKADKAKADKAKAETAAADKAKAERLAKAAEPARNWIQVGVGRNVAAFAFDWKRLAKQADGALDGKGPWAVKYGASNRMLAGPYANDAAVQAALKRLKAKDIEALPFDSAEGEKVTRAQ